MTEKPAAVVAQPGMAAFVNTFVIVIINIIPIGSTLTINDDTNNLTNKTSLNTAMALSP